MMILDSGLLCLGHPVYKRNGCKNISAIFCLIAATQNFGKQRLINSKMQLCAHAEQRTV